MKYDPNAICRKCSSAWMDVVHCKECCGWGVTEGVKYHKFEHPYQKHKPKKRRSLD